jgi:ribonuclease Y
MSAFIPLTVGIFAMLSGAILGYYARQSIAQKQAGTLEQKIQKLVSKAKEEAEEIVLEAKKTAGQILEAAKREESQRRKGLLKTEHFLLKKESVLDGRLTALEKREKEFSEKVKKLRSIRESLENLRQEAMERLEKVSKLSRTEAKKELLAEAEKEYQKEIFESLRKLEQTKQEAIEKRAREMIALAIQRCALPLAQETTTTTLSLPSDDIKGRIIGKEGRNIRTLEKLTGVEIVIDETPEAVVISGFDPVRRQIAKLALEKLVKDGRIQPARIEEVVSQSEQDISLKIQEAGETAAYEVGLIGLHPKIIQLLGRLRFRTSYGQNVLLHSIEVSHLASALASELGASPTIAKKAGFLHDIGKAVDHQVQGSHVDIGVKILEKFGIEKEVITAMKSHHEEYPAETLEAVLVQAADQISGARPGARKDTLENYLKRLEDLEAVAASFSGVERAWALQAGREIRVFVRPQEVDDLQAMKLAREVARKIQEELTYPGEIKVTVIRESRIVEYAK